MVRMWTAVQSRFMSEDGASLVEYALLVALIAVVAIVAVSVVGTKVSETFSEISQSL